MQLTFGNVRTSWVHYDKYEYRMAPDGHEYLMPAKDAKPPARFRTGGKRCQYDRKGKAHISLTV